MDWHARVRALLPDVTGDFRRDAEIHDELADYCTAREEELLQHGVSAAEAADQVMVELQATAKRRTALEAAAHRQSPHSFPRSFSWRWLIQLWQDLQYAVRLLARTPGATMAAVATLALTIGATTAIFSVVQAVLLRPLPYPEPDQLVRVWEHSPQGETRNVVSAGNYLAWSERATSFQALGAFRPLSSAALTDKDSPPEKVTVGVITASVMDVLQVRPVLGPGFTPGEYSTGQPREVMLSAGFWQRRFSGDSDIVGQLITFDDRQFTVVGVAPPAFQFPAPDVDVWFANRFSADDRTSFTSHNLNVIGRLATTTALSQSQAEMASVATGLAQEHPAEMTGWSVNVTPAHADEVREIRPLILVLMGVVLVVLLIACANLATLQLARASRRRVEMAVRSAIGAGRARLVRQLLVESLVVALAGGIVGLGVMALGLRTLVLAAPGDIPFLDTVRIDTPVLAFTMAVTMLCAILVGLLPALSISRADTRPLLRASRGQVGGAETRLRHGLVAAQIALALLLLVSAGLLVRSFWNLHAVDRGFDPTQVLTVSLELPPARYGDNTAQTLFYEDLVERLEALPSVTAAAGTTAFPAQGAQMTFSFAIEGRPAQTPSGREAPAPLQGITSGYFQAMRIALVEGRVIESTDRADSLPVVVINEALARRYWPDGGATGARIRFRENQPWYEIVGVVGNTHDEGPAVPPPPTLYVSMAQRHPSWNWMAWQNLVIRTVGDPMDALPAVRDTIWQLDKNLPLLDASTMEAAFAEANARRRFATQLLGAFAVLALGLGAIGVFGVLSCAMAERRQEIGIRLALGADPGRVATSMIRSALTWAAAGTVVGAGAALMATRFLQTLLFNVSPTDPWTFAATALLLMGVATLAAWVPARMAARLNPLSALRES